MDDCGSIPGTAKNFSFRQYVQIGFGTSPAFYAMDTVALYVGYCGLSMKLKIHLNLTPGLKTRGIFSLLPIQVLMAP
jgi:hypothetical protein